MGKQNLEEKNVTIKWLMQSDKIIKFEELDTTFDISEAVAKFDFEKAGVKGGSKVTVKIDKDEGTNGTVVFMTKSKGNTNSSKSTPSSNGDVKTVKAYGTLYDGSLLFTDDENTWYSCNKSIGVDNLSQYKDKVVEITTKTGPKGGKYVTSIKIVGDQPSTTPSTSSSNSKNSYSKNSDSRQNSIEAQACMNHANITVATLFAGKFDANNKADGELVKKLISSIAKKNWDIIQELKTNA